MNPFDAIDLYCERTTPDMWAEPVNVLSNIAFLLVAWLLWRRQFSSQFPKEIQTALRTLATLIALIGIGSTLFHLFGKRWGNWLDVGFIALFIFAYIYCYLHKLAALPNGICWLGVILFAGGNVGMAALGNLGLNGSEGYLLPGGMLIAFAIWARRIAPPATNWLLAAVCVFAVSLTLRTLDMAVCANWPLGTHFVWHLLNALVLYCCVRGLAEGYIDRNNHTTSVYRVGNINAPAKDRLHS